MKQEGVVTRCELRGGVHLDAGYVSDLCLTGQFHDCVFYEDEGTDRLDRSLTVPPSRSRRLHLAAAAASGSAWAWSASRRSWTSWAIRSARLRGALVGGTNGKGSVVALARSVLGEAGLRVGTMPKPHLVSYRERIAIDGRAARPRSASRAAVARGDARRSTA